MTLGITVIVRTGYIHHDIIGVRGILDGGISDGDMVAGMPAGMILGTMVHHGVRHGDGAEAIGGIITIMDMVMAIGHLGIGGQTTILQEEQQLLHVLPEEIRLAHNPQAQEQQIQTDIAAQEAPLQVELELQMMLQQAELVQIMRL